MRPRHLIPVVGAVGAVWFAVALSAVVMFALPARALAQSFTIAGLSFEANAAADTATLLPGSVPSFFLCGATSDNGDPTLPGLTVAQSATRVVSDANPDDEIFGQTSLDVGFSDNVVVNGDGADLVVFESGQAEAFTVALFDPFSQTFGAPLQFTPVPTGYLDGCGFPINAAQIDLDAFGVEPGTARAEIRIDNLGAPGCCVGADIADVLALHSAPPAPHPVSLPGTSFEANAAADTATVLPGSLPSFFQCGTTSETGAPTLPGLSVDASATLVVSDANPDDEIFGQTRLGVGFTDNVVVNRPGADLVVLESGRPEEFTLSVFDPATAAFTAPGHFDPTPTGLYEGCGFPVNAAHIDLSTFGIPPLGTVSNVRIDNLGAPGCCDGADLADVLAEHSAIPVAMQIKPGSSPATINLQSAGLLPVAVLSSANLDA